jgi:hypothetical protein
MPRRNVKSFMEWWKKASKKVEKVQRKGFNTAVILGAWTLWNHRNRYVFDGATPSLPSAQHFFKEETRLSCFAGARKLQELFSGCREGLV